MNRQDYEACFAKEIKRDNLIKERCDNRAKYLELLENSGQFKDRVKLELLDRFEEEDTGKIFEQWNYTFVFEDKSEAVIDARTGKFYSFKDKDCWYLEERILEDNYAEKLEEELLVCLREITCEHCNEVDCENFACLNNKEDFAHYCNDMRAE